jgi:hypothetical protein
MAALLQSAATEAVGDSTPYFVVRTSNGVPTASVKLT